MRPFEKQPALYDCCDALHYQLIIAYDGTAFWGWQAHSELPTIELALHAAIHQVHPYPFSLLAASRTDAGVHATGQCIKLSTTKALAPSFFKSLNALLPSTITALALNPSSVSFHPSLDAKEKIYRYRLALRPHPLERLYYWTCPFDLGPLETLQSRLQNPISMLVQQKDFSSLTNRLPDGKISSPHRRVIAISLEVQEPHLTFLVHGESFSYKMVRNIVGTLVAIAASRLSLDQFTLALEEGNRENMGPTAPANGLVLEKIFYKLEPNE